MSCARQVDFALLHTFVAIVDNGSFSAAAEQVGRTVSAVSMQMKRLEGEFSSAPLFKTINGRKTLTDSGEVLLSHARRILQLNEEVWSAMSGPGRFDCIRIGTPEDYAESLLPGALARFAAAFPRVQIDLVCEPSENLAKQVDQQAIDIAVLTRRPGDNASLSLRKEPIVWFAAHDAKWREESEVPFAMFQPGCVARTMALDAWGRTGRPYRVAFSSPSVAGVLSAVRGGRAVGAVARCSVPRDFRVLGEDDGFPPLPSLDIALMQNNERPREPAIDALVAEIKRTLAA